MPAPMVGLPGSSGMQTQQVIQQLMEIERKPLARIEEDNKRNQVRIQAWEELRNRARTLSNVSRDLYSFSGPFTTRSIVSSDPGAITGTTAPNVQEVSQAIRVVELATFHQIHSRPIGETEELPAASFTINTGGKDVAIRFPGGTAAVLEKTLRQQAGRDFEVSLVRVTSDTVLLTLRSGVVGRAGALRLTDPDGLLRRIELVGSNRQERPFDEPLVLKERKDPIAIGAEDVLVPDLSEDTHIQSLEFSATLKTNPETVSPAPTSGPDAAPDTRVDAAAGRDAETEAVSPGPALREKIGGIEIEAPEIQRVRKKEKAQDGTVVQGRVTVVCDYMGGRREFSIALKQNGKESMDLATLAGGPVKLVELRVKMEKGHAVELRGFHVKGSRDQEGLFGPLHEATPARDARLLVNGVEVTRPRNEGINDLISGASLTLHRTTEIPVVLKVQHQSDEIKKKIKAWVDAHNALVSFIKENDRFGSKDDFQISRPTDPSSRIDEGLRRLEDSSGIFAGDAMTRRLLVQLNDATARPYPARQTPAYRVLSEIGISTGAVGSDWKEVKKGLLVIEDAKLDQALAGAPESVRELFAGDANEDGITDTGVAFVMHRDMAPYATVSGGMIGSRIELLQDKIKANKKQIGDREMVLKRKEQTLRQKFGNMEAKMRESRSTSEYLRQKLGPQGQ